MNRSRVRHHNIYGAGLSVRTPQIRRSPPCGKYSEAGYTLVALLAVMTVLALFAMAAAPSVLQQSQREEEQEAIFRGEQMAEAIRDFYIYRSTALRMAGDQALPTSIDQLLEGIPVPGGSKKRQVLRQTAARDPLSNSGEWRLVLPRSQVLVDFQTAVTLYAGNIPPRPQSQQLQQLQQFAVPPIVNVLNLQANSSAAPDVDSASDATGPFVGVASRSKKNSVLYYYGIDRHDQWIFTPLFRSNF